MTTKKYFPKTNLFRELQKYPEILSFLDGEQNLSEIFNLLPNLTRERKEFYQILYHGVGNSPIYTIPLNNCNKLQIKLECQNNMGNNHYSRYWLIHLALAESFEIIVPTQTKIIEVTSGSSGISLSLACKQLGYNLTMIVPESLPNGRIQPMVDAGTTVMKAKGYIDACIEKLQEQLVFEEYYAANHSEEKSNLITYVFSRIAKEYRAMYGSPDVAILGLGNGSSTEAVAKCFKRAKSNTKIYAYYPSFDSKQIIFGLYGPNVELKHIATATELVDKMFYTSDFELEEIKIEYEQDEIISILGISSLFALKFAKIIAKETNGLTYFSIGYDKINRYY